MQLCVQCVQKDGKFCATPKASQSIVTRVLQVISAAKALSRGAPQAISAALSALFRGAAPLENIKTRGAKESVNSALLPVQLAKYC